MPAGENDFNLVSNAAFGVSAVRVGHAQYSFANDGGTIGAITPVNTATIPNNALIFMVCVNSTTACVGTSGTMSVGTVAGSSASSLLGATAVATLSSGAKVAGVPTPATASTWVKMTAAGAINVTIATTNFSAGVVEIYVFYYVSST